MGCFARELAMLTTKQYEGAYYRRQRDDRLQIRREQEMKHSNFCLGQRATSLAPKTDRMHYEEHHLRGIK